MYIRCSGAHRLVRAAAAAAVIVILGGCEGDNLFKNTAPVTEGPPTVKQLLVPDAVFEGDVVPVRVEAVARRGLSQILIQYRGALNTDQNFGYAAGTDSAVVNTSVQIFQRLDSVLVVTAVARDIAGRTSATRTDTVIVRQQPVLGARPQ